MDKISSIPWNVSPMVTRDPTFMAFLPFLEKNRSLITTVTKKPFKYGETDRHYLDIYYPPNKTPSDSSTPILFFVYGGGFITGSRNRPPPIDLIYSCLGSFFAKHGFITVIPDYCLAPEFKYPNAIQDVLQAIQWTLSHASHLVSETTPNPDLDSLFIMGHSAGAVHTATLILHPTLIPVDSDLRKKIKGIVLASGPYHYYADSKIFEAHWGTEEDARENSAVSLLIKSFDGLPKEKLPEILVVVAQFEPKWIMDMGVEYHRLLEWHLGEPVVIDVVKDHNHISLNCALSTGEGEEWGVRTANWIRKVAQGDTASIAGAEILRDVDETDKYECSKCQKRRTRSFSVEIGTRSVRSKTFFICLECGNKWLESDSA